MWARRFAELSFRRDAAEGLSEEDILHRAGAAGARVGYGADGSRPALEQITELEARLEAATDTAVVEELEEELTRLHLRLLEFGRRVVEGGGGGYVPYQGEETLDPPFVGSGKRRSTAAQSAYWPPRDLLRREHQHAVALRQALPAVDLNDLMKPLEEEYGGEDQVSADDSLAHIRGELPSAVDGCLVAADIGCYSITSKGALGGGLTTFFVPRGDHAEVIIAGKKGRQGWRDTGGVGPLRHCKVLKALGFRTVGREGGRKHPLK